MHDILVDNLAFPEGPAFAPDDALWWVEIHGGALGRRSVDGVVEHIAVGGHPNGAAFDSDGRLWICDPGESAIRRHDPAAGETVTVVGALAGEPLGKPNDLAFDPAGNLVFTCPNDAREEPKGYVCCLSVDGELTKIADGLYFPNGLAFTPDGAHLVVAETYRHRLWKGRWDAAARSWIDPKPWVEAGGPVGPDGMAFGDDGKLYVAVFGQSAVRIVGDTGAPLEALDIPGERPTNVAFDPSGTLGLVVTEAEQGRLFSFPAIRSRSMLFPRSA